MAYKTLPDKLTTSRLYLRRWTDSDLEPFATLNRDPEVMRYFPSTLDLDQTAAMIERIEIAFEQDALGLWAVEERAGGDFVGFVGLEQAKI